MNDLKELDEEFAEIINDFALENIWKRDGLPNIHKSIATISALVASGKEDQLYLHMKAFLNLGGTIDELRNILIHLSVYCGFPAILNSFKVLNKVKVGGNNECLD